MSTNLFLILINFHKYICFLASYHVINFDMLTNEVDQENLAKWIRSSATSVLAFTYFGPYVAYYKISKRS
jgi:hypothetical protein